MWRRLRCFFGLHDWARADIFGDHVQICEHCMAFAVTRSDE